MKLGSLLFAIVTLFPTLSGAAPGQIAVKKLTFTVVRNGRDAQGPTQDSFQQTLYLAPDGRELLDSNDTALHKHTVQITLSNGQTQTLDTSSKTYTTSSQAEMESHVNRNLKKDDLGSKSIEGFQCQGWADSSPAGRVEHWWCTDPASGRKFLGGLDFRKADGAEWRQTLTGVTANVNVPESFFEIPADYRPASGN